jgi:hypothetical protein
VIAHAAIIAQKSKPTIKSSAFATLLKKLFQLFVHAHIRLHFLFVNRPLGKFIVVTDPTLSISAVVRILFAKSTLLLIAFALNNERICSDGASFDVRINVNLTVYRPITLGDRYFLMPSSHTDLRSDSSRKAGEPLQKAWNSS